jgi:hypothetical protein
MVFVTRSCEHCGGFTFALPGEVLSTTPSSRSSTGAASA